MHQSKSYVLLKHIHVLFLKFLASTQVNGCRKFQVPIKLWSYLFLQIRSQLRISAILWSLYSYINSLAPRNGRFQMVKQITKRKTLRNDIFVTLHVLWLQNQTLFPSTHWQLNWLNWACFLCDLHKGYWQVPLAERAKEANNSWQGTVTLFVNCSLFSVTFIVAVTETRSNQVANPCRKTHWFVGLVSWVSKAFSACMENSFVCKHRAL